MQHQRKECGIWIADAQGIWPETNLCLHIYLQFYACISIYNSMLAYLSTKDGWYVTFWDNRVIFDNANCTIEIIKYNKTLFIGQRVKNIYIFSIDDIAPTNETCFKAMNNNGWLCHRRLEHARINLISNFSKRI